jgi:hypothetical protein
MQESQWNVHEAEIIYRKIPFSGQVYICQERHLIVKGSMHMSAHAAVSPSAQGFPNTAR